MHFFTTSIPNLKECASGLPDGASRATTLIQLLYEREQGAKTQWPRAVAQLDTTNAFNALSRYATFDSITGIASNECDSGNAPTSRMGQMVQLHQAQSIVTVGPTRVVDPRDYFHFTA